MMLKLGTPFCGLIPLKETFCIIFAFICFQYLKDFDFKRNGGLKKDRFDNLKIGGLKKDRFDNLKIGGL
jgi:hypothetical protein